MCGEIDEQVLIGQELLDRTKALAKRMAKPVQCARGSRKSYDSYGCVSAFLKFENSTVKGTCAFCVNFSANLC